MARSSTKPRRFRLSFVGPIEDQPRLIRAYGRACDGEFALVMRPSEARAVLVLITKGDGAFVWRTDTEPDDDGLVHAQATVLRDGKTTLRIETGEHTGVRFQPHEDLAVGVEHGDMVSVAFSPDDQFATVIGAGTGGDSPVRPHNPISSADAVKLIKVEQKAVPKAGPTTLRGRWTGTITCDDGAPRVELRRKLATYGTLTVRSNLEAGWSWSFERSDKWFSDVGETTGDGLPTLSSAIEAGVLGAMSLVREACSFRDTRRRAAHDPTYATKHPIKPPRAMKNPTERLKVRDRKRKGRKAPPPRPIDDGSEPPEVPTDAAALDHMAETASTEGAALARLKGRTWIWQETTPTSEIAQWFDDNGFQGMSEAIVEYDHPPGVSVSAFIGDLGKDLKAAETIHDDDPDPAVYKEAKRQLVLLRESLTSTPSMMERARKLIRYAASLADSPLCKGREQQEAIDAIERAGRSYEEAREAILGSRPWDAMKTLKRIGEKVALSAARAAKSCAAGQMTITAADSTTPEPSGVAARMPKKKTESAYAYARRLLSEANARAGEGHHRVVRELLAEAKTTATGLSSSKATRIYDRIEYIEAKLAETKGPKRKAQAPAPEAGPSVIPEGWDPFEIGDRVVFKDLHGMVKRVPQGGHGPEDKVTFLADGRKRGRRVEAKLLEPEGELAVDSAEATEPEPEVDAEKDKVLIDAFSAAIAAALGEAA